MKVFGLEHNVGKHARETALMAVGAGLGILAHAPRPWVPKFRSLSNLTYVLLPAAGLSVAYHLTFRKYASDCIKK